MKIALCQLDIVWEDKEKNFLKVEGFLKRAARDRADLVLFPEMTLTGFSMNTGRTAERDRETVKRFSELAASQCAAAGFGWVESRGDKALNHYTVVSSKGETLSDYVKIHPFSYGEENRHFTPGDSISLFSAGGFDISTFVCYDLRFPEIFQAASRSAGLIIVAANWPAARKDHWRVLLRARAIENQAFVAGVNCVGYKNGLFYSGDTMLVDPQGVLIKELESSEGLSTAEIDMGEVTRCREAFPVKLYRKNEFYKTIL